MEFFTGFIFGIIFGWSVFLAYGLHLANKVKNNKSAALTDTKAAEDISELTKKKNSIYERLQKAADLAQTQRDLCSQAEMPSKNAVHSKYKNGLVHEINEIEKQKMEILKSILDDGFDPTITIVNEAGKQEKIALSAYLSTYGVPLSGDDEKAKRRSKFVIYKGGKDDGTVH